MRTGLIGVIVSLLLAACGEEKVATVDGGVVIPGVGSEFRTRIADLTDSNGTETEVVVLVNASNMIVEGKERVVQFAADTLSSLVCYELDGALSIYMKKGTIAGCEVERAWLRFPFGEALPVEETLEVRRSGLSDEPVVCLASWTARAEGEETIGVNDSSYRTLRSVGEFRVAESSGENDTVWRTRRYEVWFAPEVGYAVQEKIGGYRITGDKVDTLGMTVRELLTYSLKGL